MDLSFSPARPCRIEDVPAWDIETGVAIVGFGAAACLAVYYGRAFIFGGN